VALMTRTSAFRAAVSPIRWNSLSCRKRRSRAWATGDISATSSTNRVPPSPWPRNPPRRHRAGEGAPGVAEELRREELVREPGRVERDEGPPRSGERSCSAFATISLPVPSPRHSGPTSRSARAAPPPVSGAPSPDNGREAGEGHPLALHQSLLLATRGCGRPETRGRLRGAAGTRTTPCHRSASVTRARSLTVQNACPTIPTVLRFITAGESHGPALTVVVEGLPAGVPVVREAIDADLRAGREATAAAGGCSWRPTRSRSSAACATAARSAARLLLVRNRDHESWAT